MTTPDRLPAEAPDQEATDPAATGPEAGDAEQFRNRYDPNIAGLLAARLMNRDVTPGDAAGLRRMNPKRPGSALYWKLMLRYHITDPNRPANDNAQVEQAWAQILATIADGTRVGQEETSIPHDPSIPFGKALATAGYHQARFEALLNAGESQVQKLTDHAARFLHANSQHYNCTDLARLMLTPLRSKAQRDADRTYTARNYHREMYRQSQEVSST